MATILVSIICLAMIVVGGMTLSHGILTSTDTAALGVDEISVREGDIARTRLDILRAAHLSWADLLRVTVTNTGQTKLASFSKWDLIVHYDDGDVFHTVWLPWTEVALNDNEWRKARIGLEGPIEFFEPGILNPGEELVMLARLSPVPGDNTTGEITVVSPNGIYDSITFDNPDYTLLIPHSENITIAGTKFYELAETTAADGTAVIDSTDIFQARETARKIMRNENDPSRVARHIFSLTGISTIPAATWTVYYRCLASELGNIQDNEISFDIDILIRRADGTVRTTIATEVANAYLLRTETNIWLTKSASYGFPGYTVVDDNDYLEIVYYGEIEGNGSNSPGYLKIRIDDSTLAMEEQTRIEA